MPAPIKWTPDFELLNNENPEGEPWLSASPDGRFSQAVTADLRIIYETDNGNLWYDADGTGAILRVQFGDLAAGLAVTASDFTVF